MESWGCMAFRPALLALGSRQAALENMQHVAGAIIGVQTETLHSNINTCTHLIQLFPGEAVGLVEVALGVREAQHHRALRSASRHKEGGQVRQASSQLRPGGRQAPRGCSCCCACCQPARPAGSSWALAAGRRPCPLAWVEGPPGARRLLSEHAPERAPPAAYGSLEHRRPWARSPIPCTRHTCPPAQPRPAHLLQQQLRAVTRHVAGATHQTTHALQWGRQ